MSQSVERSASSPEKGKSPAAPSSSAASSAVNAIRRSVAASGAASARPEGVSPLPAAAKPTVKTAETSLGRVSGAQALLRLQANTLVHQDLESAAIGFCAELAALLQCDRVSLGMLRAKHCEVVGLSSGTVLEVETSVLKLIEGAMEESTDQAAALVVPSGGDQRRIVRAQAQLQKLTHGTVITVPLATQERTVGAITLEFESIQSDCSPLLALCEDASAMFSSFFMVLQRDALPWWKRMRPVASRKSAWSRNMRLVLGAAIVAMLALCMVPLPYSIGAPARIEGLAQRSVVTPTAGFLKTVLARPGDTVKAGQVLAEMLDRDLQIDRNKISAELEQHESAYSVAMAKADRAGMMLSQAKTAEARAQIDLIDQQLSRVALTAPIDGQVIQGDLTQMIGSPLEKGQTLMLIAPANQHRVIVEVDERDITGIKIGQRGHLSLSALPWDSLAIEVIRVTPMATTIEDRSAFEVEARLVESGAVQQLRSGQRGVVSLDAGSAPLLPLWSRRLVEHMHRLWWRWVY